MEMKSLRFKTLYFCELKKKRKTKGFHLELKEL